MQNNSSLKIWKALVWVLVVLNVFLISSIWLKRDGTHPGPDQGPPGGEKASDFLAEQLHLSPQQTTDFTTLKHTHHEAVMALQEKGKELHQVFFDQLKNNSVDSVQIKEMAAAIANNQTQIELLTFKHFVQVRKLCDDKQRQKFDEIIQEVLQRMSGPHGKQGPPPPPPQNG